MRLIQEFISTLLLRRQQSKINSLAALHRCLKLSLRLTYKAWKRKTRQSAVCRRKTCGFLV